MRKTKTAILILAVLATAGIVYTVSFTRATSVNAQSAPPRVLTTTPQQSYADVVDRVAPAVVTVPNAQLTVRVVLV